jgi:Zn-dependent protease with chaperone function
MSHISGKSLHPFFNTPYTPQQSLMSLRKRATELQHRLNQLFQSMGGKRKIQLCFHNDLFPSTPPFARANQVHLPVLPLISPNEFPAHLQVKDLNDPRLDDPKFFEQVADWISEVFLLPRSKVSWMDKHTFKLYLRLMENPEMATKALHFIYLHELGHILRHHDEQPCTNSESFFYKLMLFLTAVIIWVHEPWGQSIEKWTNSMATKKLEREADKIAVVHSKDVEGAAYLLRTMQAQNTQTRSDPTTPKLVKLFLTPSGDSIPLILSHQLNSNRIASIRSDFAEASSLELSSV